MRFKITSGSLAGGLGLIGTGVPIMYPDVKWVGALFIVLGGAVFLFDVSFEHGHVEIGEKHPLRRRLRMVGPQLLMALGALAFVGGAGWWWIRNHSPAVEAPEPAAVARNDREAKLPPTDAAPVAPPPTPAASGHPPAPPAPQVRLRRLIVYEAPVLNLLDPQTVGGPQVLSIVNMPIRNAGEDTIKLWVEFVLSANDRAIFHYKPGPETIVQQTQEARFPGQQFDREVPPEATEIEVEVTVTYDTIPETGRRISRRTYVYALARPNGPGAPAALGAAVNTRQSED